MITSTPQRPPRRRGSRIRVSRRLGALLIALLTLVALAASALGLYSARASSQAQQVIATDPPSSNPLTANLAYARCLRQHGVPHPDPDRRGDFELTPADERRLRSVPRAKRKAAEDACFHHLKGLNLQPLSPRAITRSKRVLADLATCVRRKGHRVGAPLVRKMSRGRAWFGLKSLPHQNRRFWQSRAGKRLLRDMRVCEKKIGMARRISKIIDEDRRRSDP